MSNRETNNISLTCKSSRSCSEASVSPIAAQAGAASAQGSEYLFWYGPRSRWTPSRMYIRKKYSSSAFWSNACIEYALDTKKVSQEWTLKLHVMWNSVILPATEMREWMVSGLNSPLEYSKRGIQALDLIAFFGVWCHGLRTCFLFVGSPISLYWENVY